MGNYIRRILQYYHERSFMIDLRRRPSWNTMIHIIDTTDKYTSMVNELFADGKVNEGRLLVLKWFTRDLCHYHGNDAFWEKYIEYEKGKKKP